MDVRPRDLPGCMSHDLLNILLVGPVGSGKTTTQGAILDLDSDRTVVGTLSNGRVIVCELGVPGLSPMHDGCF